MAPDKSVKLLASIATAPGFPVAIGDRQPGAAFGLVTLLGRLNSCTSNVSVVNIDNGFGGG